MFVGVSVVGYKRDSTPVRSALELESTTRDCKGEYKHCCNSFIAVWFQPGEVDPGLLLLFAVRESAPSPCHRRLLCWKKTKLESPDALSGGSWIWAWGSQSRSAFDHWRRKRRSLN